MLSHVLQHKPLLKRVPTIVDRTNGIQLWDSDNLYPQRAEETRDRSYTAKIATDRLAGFVMGGGFEDPLLSSLVLNRDGQTGNDVLDLITQDDSIYNAYGLLINYNLNYRISEIKVVEAKFCRFGLPDRWSKVYDIKVNNNWERDPYKNMNYGWEIFEYPIFNPDPNVVKQQMMQAGGIMNYKGQVLFFTPKPNVYPLCTFDAVFDHAQIQSELGVFDISAIQNGFTATTLFKYPGTFEDEDEKHDFTRKLNDFKGPKGAATTMVIENPTGQDYKLTESLNIPSVDKLHEVTNKNASKALRVNYSMPMEILGETPESGMFNKQSIQEAYEFYNTITEPRRDRIARQMKKIFAYWKDQNLALVNTNIKPKAYGTGQPISNAG
jgi:hypothetical protein